MSKNSDQYELITWDREPEQKMKFRDMLDCLRNKVSFSKRNVIIASSVAAAVIVFISGLTVYSIHRKNVQAEAIALTAMQAAQHVYTPNEIEDSVLTMDRKIDGIEQQVTNNRQLDAQLSKLQNSIVALQQQVSVQSADISAIQNTTQSISQNINATTQQAASSLNQINTAVKALSLDLQPVKYASPSILPFKVVSVDFWNGVAKATLTLDGDYVLMMQGQSRAGWTLMSIATSPTDVLIFANSKNELVKVTL